MIGIYTMEILNLEVRKEAQTEYGKLLVYSARLLANNKIEVTDEMILKTGKTTLKLKLINN